MGQQTSISDLALPDVPSDATTWEYGGTDRIDITVIGANDAALELRPPGGAPWSDPQRIRAAGPAGISNFRSITGLSVAFPPRGPIAFRLSNWTPGEQAVVDVVAFNTT